MTAPEIRAVKTPAGRITFRLRYSDRARRASLRLKPSTGLEIVLPWSEPPEYADSVLLKHLDWVLTHQVRAEKTLANSPSVPSPHAWLEGGDCLLSGIGVPVTFSAPQNAIVRRDDGTPEGIHLRVGLNASEADKTKALETLIKTEAKAYLGKRLAHCLKQSPKAPTGWQLSGAKGRWGSCTSAQRIRLAWRLLFLPEPLVDAVIYHELGHLLEMNHSPAFWKGVEGMDPDYKVHRAELKAWAAVGLPL